MAALAVLFTILPYVCPPILRPERPAGLSTMFAWPLALVSKLFASTDFAELTLIQWYFSGGLQETVRSLRTPLNSDQGG